MTKIEDNFNGYLQIGDDGFVYNVNGHIVSLMPTENDLHKRMEILNKLCAKNNKLPELIYGDDNNYNVAFFRNTEFMRPNLLYPIAIFPTPLIIKSTGNTGDFDDDLSGCWNKFNSITFCGGSINSLFNPRIAVEPLDMQEIISGGAIGIGIRPNVEYTKQIDCSINGEKLTFTISINKVFGKNGDDRTRAYSLGEINSIIHLDFDAEQDFDRIPEYYKVIKSLVSILIGQNNVFFDIYVSRTPKGEESRKTGICKFADKYQNYANVAYGKAIHLLEIFECIPKLISIIESKEADVILSLLPVDNRDVHRVSITDIQNICTALEVAYDWQQISREKDELVKELKKDIKKTINDFLEKKEKEQVDIDIDKKTNIASAFKHLDYTLKEKILTLYTENAETIDEIIKGYSSPPINYETVHNFVKLRDNKTHAGLVDWGDRANIYYSLLAIIYLCLFKKAELDDETAKKAVRRFFGVN